MDPINALNWLASVNPLWYVAALVIYSLFGDKIKALISLIPRPSLVSAASSTHPLATILLGIVSKKFNDLTGANVDPHDAYVALANAVKNATTPKT